MYECNKGLLKLPCIFIIVNFTLSGFEFGTLYDNWIQQGAILKIQWLACNLNTCIYSCIENDLDTTTPKPPVTVAPPVTPGPGGFVCPIEDIARTGCKGPVDCLYPNDNGDCTTFIQCTVNADNRTGTPVVKDCPLALGGGKLEWNDVKKVCDWPPVSNCGKERPID